MLCKHFNVGHKSLQHKIQVSIEQFNCILTRTFQDRCNYKNIFKWNKTFNVAHRHKTL